MKLPLHARKATVAHPITIRDAAGTVIAKFDTMGQDNMAAAEAIALAINMFPNAITQLSAHEQTPKIDAQQPSH